MIIIRSVFFSLFCITAISIHTQEFDSTKLNKMIADEYEQKMKARVTPLDSAKRGAAIGFSTGLASNLCIKDARIANASGIVLAIGINELSKKIIAYQNKTEQDKNIGQYTSLFTGYIVGAIIADGCKAFIRTYITGSRS